MDKVIITGASGFLGKCLIGSFSDKEKYQVFALTSKPDSLEREVEAENVVFLDRNCLFDGEQAESIIRDSQIINCAFPRNTDGINMAKGLEYIQKVFCSAAAHKARAIINISSQSVYSQKRTEMANEGTELNLESVYATGKYATELMLNTICRALPHTNLRLSSLIGPSFNQRITNKLIDSVIATKGAKVSINERRFGFMDVRDAAGAIFTLVETDPKIWKEVYCVGTGRGYSLIEISDAITKLAGELLGFAPEIITVCTEESGDTAVSGELLKEDTGFISKYSLEESLREIFLTKLSKCSQE